VTGCCGRPRTSTASPTSIAELLSERFGSDVHVDNDATCATVAEWLLGAGRASTT
jgi:predicted NBD/HSP70 family sugar kinase